jgi:hypothetical protein
LLKQLNYIDPNELPRVGVLDGAVCVVSHPLKEDEENEVAEDEDEEDQLRDELQENLGVLPVVHLVPKTERDTENLKSKFYSKFSL